MHCTEPGCDHNYLYHIFRMESATTWGFQIGTPIGKEPTVLVTKGTYNTKKEAEIAAKAFIAGMIFMKELQ